MSVGALKSSYDVVVVGGGPGGLSAALAFGRGRAHALLVDGGTPRNARAEELHNFVTRDGTPPPKFRALAHEELARYSAFVEVRTKTLVTSVERLAKVDHDDSGCAFQVTLESGETTRARRILLATGMRDELPAIEGLAELWGHTVFQCPYCHGWELSDRPWGVFAPNEQMALFAPILTNWSSHLTVFLNGSSAMITPETLAKLRGMKEILTIEPEKIARLHADRVELASGRTVPCAALVMRPPQTPVEIVLALSLERDEQGYVRVDPQTKESTSTPGVHVIGDTTTMRQGAIMAAADGTIAAASINHALIMERAGAH